MVEVDVVLPQVDLGGDERPVPERGLHLVDVDAPRSIMWLAHEWRSAWAERPSRGADS